MKAEIVSIRKWLWGLWWETKVKLEDGREFVIRTRISPFFADTDKLAKGWIGKMVEEKIRKESNDNKRIARAIGTEIIIGE